MTVQMEGYRTTPPIAKNSDDRIYRMKPSIYTFLAATTAGILWLGTTHAFAQDDAPPPPPPPPAEAAGSPGAGGPGGGGDRQDRMEKFRQQMNERIKTQLKASDGRMGRHPAFARKGADEDA